MNERPQTIATPAAPVQRARLVNAHHTVSAVERAAVRSEQAASLTSLTPRRSRC